MNFDRHINENKYVPYTILNENYLGSPKHQRNFSNFESKESKISFKQEGAYKLSSGVLSEKSERFLAKPERVKSLDSIIKIESFVRKGNSSAKKICKQGKEISKAYLMNIEQRSKSLDKKEKSQTSFSIKKITSVQDLIENMKTALAKKKYFDLWDKGK